jgi:hypothetical protein
MTVSYGDSIGGGFNYFHLLTVKIIGLLFYSTQLGKKNSHTLLLISKVKSQD